MAVTRTRTTTTAAPSADPGLNFLSLGMYVAGGGLPEGDYVVTSMDVCNHDGFSATKKGPMRLGVMITLLDLHDLKSEPRKQFYSMGSKADQSFAPNPATGKGIVAIPGGPATTFNDSTNWAVFLKSLHDCDPAIATLASNDTAVFEGMWVHMTNVPEPEGRKGFGTQASTGEAQVEERKNNTIAVVTEILDGGKPWEGTGGIPAVSPFATGKAPAVKAPAKPAPATKAPEPESTDDDVLTAALDGVSGVLEKQPNGCAKLLMRTQTFAAVKASAGDDVAQLVIQTYFKDDAALDTVLGQLGYKVAGTMVKPL